MQSFGIGKGFHEAFLSRLRSRGEVFGPVQGKDGVCRLGPLRRWKSLSPNLPLLPPKKYFFPPEDRLWSLSAEEYRGSIPEASPFALLGLAPCELYALEYLDRALADDPHYLQRRSRAFVVGVMCQPTEDCFCPRRQNSPPFDIFLTSERAWCGSTEGRALLDQMMAYVGDCDDLPLPEEVTVGRQEETPTEVLMELFHQHCDHPLWGRHARACLSCGACSAVCPTCTCYDVFDEMLPGAAPQRVRTWDNCFFRNHGLVAGGHNFRPDRGARLRFRFDHKFLGFGPLRGESSCVGCGRCARACPVDIDLTQVRDALLASAQGT